VPTGFAGAASTGAAPLTAVARVDRHRVYATARPSTQALRCLHGWCSALLHATARTILIAAWPVLAGWIRIHRVDEQRRRQFEAAAAQWVERGRGPPACRPHREDRVRTPASSARPVARLSSPLLRPGVRCRGVHPETVPR
jgi:hypothetical protein